MKVLLIDPPFYRFIGYYNRYFPLGLALLAAVLQKKDHDVLIYDADSNVEPSKMDFTRLEEDYPVYLDALKDDHHIVWQQMREKISSFNPDIVGITVWTNFAASAFKIASICKNYNKNVPVVMGGPHISTKYDEVMEICRDVDFLIRGEGEQTFPELVEYIQNNRENNSKKLSYIKGISYRQNGKPVHNEKREFIAELDSIPFPDRNLLANKLSYDSEDMGLMMTSRGCPYSCSYCATSIWERNVRYRSIDNVLKEIEMVIDKFGTRQFTFKDDSFTVSKKRSIEFCNSLIEKNIKINWDCNTRANLVDEELLIKMKKAGCNSVKIGVETGSERILNIMNKKVTLDQYRHAAGLLRKVGIHWTGYFMMGLPSETKSEVYKTLDFMRELQPDYASLSVYEPFPGTQLYEIGLEKGLVDDKRVLDDFYNKSPKYYYVKDVNHRVDTMSGKEFDALEKEMKEEFHKYNRGISKLTKRARSRSKIYMHDPKVILSDFKKLLNWM